MTDIEAQAELAVAQAMLRDARKEQRMKHWTSEQYPLETLDKIPMEDKSTISHEEALWYDIDGDPIEWRELAPEERLLLCIDILDSIPEEQRTEEVMEAIGEAISETERRLCEPR